MSQNRIFETNAEHIYPLISPDLSLDFINGRSIDPRYTFTRNSSATYVDANGIIRTAAPNQPRFDYDPITGECKGLLVEEARTNLALRSEELGALGLIGSGVITNNFGISPSGLLNARRLSPGVGAGPHGAVFHNSNAYAPNGWQVSAYIKPLGLPKLGILTSNGSWGTQYPVSSIDFDTLTFTNTAFGDSTSFYGRSITDVGNGWYRVVWRWFYSVNGNSTMAFICGLSTSGDWNAGQALWNFDGTPYVNNGFLIWGIQIENAAFPTSYIPTTTSAVTRQPDQLVLNNAPLSSQGTFYLEARPTTGTGLVADNGSSTLALTPTLNQTTKNALFYNTSRTLSMSSSITPVEGNYDVPQNLNRVSLGFDGFYNSSYINGHIKNFKYYGSPVTEDNLRSLTGNTRPTFRFVEQIITDGLVLNLDAGNPASYPGSGTTWTDLSGNGNNGTLVNGVGYSSDKLGSLSFDGVNDYIDCGNSAVFNQSGGKSFTVTCWALFNTATLNHNPVFTKAEGSGTWEYTLGLNSSRGVSWLTSSNGTSWVGRGVNETISLSIWYYYAVGFDFANQVTFASINGKQIYTSTQTGIHNGSRAFEIGRHTDPVTTMNGRISNLNYYNRALSAAEISQNYNALKGRYGLS
jgi:hypothetical protein